MITHARFIRLRFFIAFGLVAIVLWVAIAFALHAAYRQEIERARIEGRNLARGLATQVESSVMAIDRSLLFLRDDWEEGHGAFAAAVARHGQFLIDESVSQVSVIDADGWIAYSNLPDWQRVEIGDRQHIRVHNESGTDELYISAPVLGRVTKQWLIRFTRPIYDGHKQLCGVLVFSVPPPALERIYHDIELGVGGIIALARSDGQVLAHSLDLDKAATVSLSDTPGLGPGDAVSGEFRRKAKIDGVERFYSYHKAGRYPLTVFVGQAADTVLAPYYAQRTNYVTSGVLATALLLAVTLLLISRSQRYDKERAERVRSQIATIVENSNDAIVGRDLDRKIVIWNTAAERLLGWTAAEAIGQELTQMFPPEEEPRIAANRKLVIQGGTLSHEAVRIAKDGHRVEVSLGVSPIKDDRGNIIGSAAICRDLTERKQAEARIQHLAHYDSLTDIPNRRLFYDRLGHATSLSRRDRSELALLYIDLDEFKAVNDTFGHAAGDELLKCVADRIREALRESDTLARMGGDEFAVILPAITNREDVAKVAAKIIGALSASYKLSGHAREVTIGASIGIAIYPADAQDIDALIKAADTAMYNAKQTGNSFRFCGA
jgi:diguanylate cyclase (GGDEF)-like protein/PAS domain S-box-containing protein